MEELQKDLWMGARNLLEGHQKDFWRSVNKNFAGASYFLLEEGQKDLWMGVRNLLEGRQNDLERVSKTLRRGI